MKSFYITTAIDYANGKPHLGHAYEKVLTDVVARFRRLMGDDVYFLTGLDEHGQKVQQSAPA
ncbi:MAG TPA: methionine--tRNA ligase, partial [Opitutae bacterium]|nr:methionine--tRNA ligase [Opitutae bacterium]